MLALIYQTDKITGSFHFLDFLNFQQGGGIRFIVRMKF